jgi:type IV secretion system protein VirB5
MLRKRFLIETVLDTLKSEMGLEHSRHRSVSNAMVHVLSRRLRFQAGQALHLAHKPTPQGVSIVGVPYVIERDRLGDEVTVGLANRAMPIDPRTIQAEVSRWVHDVRTVSTDMQDERSFIYEAFDHTDKNGPATNELSQWFKDNVPWVRAKENIVTVEILSALPMDQNVWHTWRVDWRENTLTRSGVLQQSHVWEVILTVSVIPPRTETEVRKNHAGVFIENFSWSTRGS